MNGWVKLHRQLLENVDLMQDDTAYILFTKLLLLSNSKGEIAYTGRDLAKRVNMNHSTMYKALKRLEKYQISKQLGKQRYTHIVICNWGKYQDTGKHFGKQTVNRRETDGKQTTGVARIENKNKEKESIKKEDFRGEQSPAKERLRKMLQDKGVLKTV